MDDVTIAIQQFTINRRSLRLTQARVEEDLQLCSAVGAQPAIPAELRDRVHVGGRVATQMRVVRPSPPARVNVYSMACASRPSTFHASDDCRSLTQPWLG